MSGNRLHGTSDRFSLRVHPRNLPAINWSRSLLEPRNGQQRALLEHFGPNRC